MDTQNRNPQLMRVLTRPPQSPVLPPSESPVLPSQQQPSQNGVVVVGFVGKRHGDVTQIINRIIDDNVFGSGNLDTPFPIEKKDVVNEEIEEWFKCRSISYYFEAEKGVLYLQFSSISCPVMDGILNSEMGLDSCPVMDGILNSETGLDSTIEDQELGDLQGLLFIFCVCHVVIYIQEGSRFDTQIFKKFRVLQSAKHAVFPFLKLHCLPLSTTSSHASSSSRTSASIGSSSNVSPNRSRGMLNRSASAVTLMSGLGLHSSLMPGQCTPVILFVFLDDFTESNPSSSIKEQSESSNNSVRPSLTSKAPSPVVVLTRPMGKPEGGFRKKLQSSLESQIRFSIKRCRLLSSPETSYTGTRNGSHASSAPLFLLDASKVVALISIVSNQKGESLRFATSLLEDVLDGKATSDSLLLESSSQTSNKEDILSVKEFIFRQSDILRGRGTMVSSASSSSSAAGVGMVAVAAAAAAAASTSSRKQISSPDLPSLETWLSSSQPILSDILSVKLQSVTVNEFSGTSILRNDVPPCVGGNPKATNSLETAVSLLESGRGLNSKFSILWCEKALPSAKEIYLKDLPPCYPTSLHNAHLERALLAFKSMVKGSAVPLYTKRLHDECTSIWNSGRQLCDAISLTGKPCMHKRHDLEIDVFPLINETVTHCSGYVFLHACVCGRSRRLRPDPFDFETANVSFNSLAECDNHLPALQLPQSSVKGHLCWNLIRIGSARYYNPAKGLLQSGFSRTEKFLLTWTLSMGINKNEVALLLHPGQIKSNKLCTSSTDEALTAKEIKVIDVGTQRNVSTNSVKSDGRIISKATMRKQFSEVVAGSTGTSAAFPPLQTRRLLRGAEKVIKQQSIEETEAEKINSSANNHKHRETPEPLNGSTINDGPDDPFLQIGSNVVPVNSNNNGVILNGCTSPKQVTLYVGFEHECPYGHRFILSPDHLDYLGPLYALPEETTELLTIDNSDIRVEDMSKFSKNEVRSTGRGEANGNNRSDLQKSSKMKGRDAFGNADREYRVQISTSLKEQKHDEDDLGPISLDDRGYAFNILNRNIPIYMNCPHCTDSKKKGYMQETKYACTISQLQRIFLVTPPFPVVLATCPVVQFQESCLPPTISDRESKLQFSLDIPVILPSSSFLSIRLPFIYGAQLEEGNLHPLTYFENQPELTAWINKGTALQIMSDGSNPKKGLFS